MKYRVCVLVPVCLALQILTAQSLITEDPADPEGPSVSVAADLLIGDSAQPQDLHVHGDTLLDGNLGLNGALNIGTSTTTPTSGAIRWTGSDFEGYDGSGWKSLTQSLSDRSGTLRDPDHPESPLITADKEVVTVGTNMKINGSLTLKDSIAYQSFRGETVYFKWSRKVPFAPTVPGKINTSLPNQAIYVDLGNKWIWGALTVTLVGDWHSGKNTGIIRKTFALGRNPNWKNSVDGEQMELALGPITRRYKIGTATSESGNLRIPIYKIVDTRNRVTVFVEGHLSLSSAVHNFNPSDGISFTPWETVDVDHVEERIKFDVEHITSDVAQLNPLAERPENPNAGAIYYDTGSQDFQGYDGTTWKSLTVSIPNGSQGDLSMGRFTAN